MTGIVILIHEFCCSERAVCNAVVPGKDVDGFHLINVGRFCTDLKSLLPATPAGIMELLRRTGISTLTTTIHVSVKLILLRECLS